MVIGSGPIIIGQAAEFDYAGSQACRALREDGLEVVQQQPRDHYDGFEYCRPCLHRAADAGVS